MSEFVLSVDIIGNCTTIPSPIYYFFHNSLLLLLPSKLEFELLTREEMCAAFKGRKEYRFAETSTLRAVFKKFTSLKNSRIHCRIRVIPRGSQRVIMSEDLSTVDFIRTRHPCISSMSRSFKSFVSSELYNTSNTIIHSYWNENRRKQCSYSHNC